MPQRYSSDWLCIISVELLFLSTLRTYARREGTVSIKTVETSMEKRTLVEGGHVETTVHEMETVDGKVIKDDVVRFASDDAPAVTGR